MLPTRYQSYLLVPAIIVGLIAYSAVAAQAATRRDITTLSASELTAYRDAFRQFQANGEYARFAGNHGCPDYYCHNDIRIFLPWHRAYVLRFEQALQQINSALALHYWDWTSDDAINLGIPRAFTDSQYQSGGTTYDNPLRSFHFECGGRDSNTQRNPDQPFLLSGLRDRVSAAYQLTSYASFNGNGGVQGPHGSLHLWVGVDMSDTEWAAYDPIFWAHHSNVDRQWAKWQDGSTGSDPSTQIMQLELVPFGMKVSDVIDYRALGYEYDGFGRVLFVSLDEAKGQSIKIRKIPMVVEGQTLSLFVENIPDHPSKSVRVYVFIDQPNATLADVRKDNPNFAGFFGIFGGRHGKGHKAHDVSKQHNEGAKSDRPAESTPVLDLTRAITRLAASKKLAEGAKMDVTLTILATDPKGKPISLSELPFKGVAVRPGKKTN